MACPNCESRNTRIAERDILKNTYFCNDCQKPYEKIAPHVWAMGGNLVGAVFGVPFIGSLLAFATRLATGDGGGNAGGDADSSGFDTGDLF